VELLSLPQYHDAEDFYGPGIYILRIGTPRCYWYQGIPTWPETANLVLGVSWGYPDTNLELIKGPNPETPHRPRKSTDFQEYFLRHYGVLSLVR
jgi:hypothetical protein